MRFIEEGHLGSKQTQQLLAALPKALARQVQELSERTGNSPEEVIQRGVRVVDLATQEESKDKPSRNFEANLNNPLLMRLVPDPDLRKLYITIRTQVEQHRQSKVLKDDAARSGWAAKGGAARKDSLDPDKRKAIASKAAKARWEKKKKSNEPTSSTS